TGRYAAGGLATGCYAVAAAVANPLVARLADRIGPARVLRVGAATHALLLAALALLVAAPLPLLLIVSALAGAACPPLTGAIRGAWTTITAVGPPAGTGEQAALAA